MAFCWNLSVWEAHNSTYHPHEKALEAWTVACAPFTIVLNAVVLYIAARYITIRDHLNQCFVVLMTVAYLVHGLVYMATKPYVYCFPLALCVAYYFVVWLTNMLSVLALLFLNVDKFIYVAMPRRYSSLITPRVVALEIFAGCALSLGTCFLIYYAAVTHSQWHIDLGLTECKIFVAPHYYAVLTILFYIVPMLACLAISIYIFGVVQKSMREDAKRAASMSTSQDATNHPLMPAMSQSARDRAASADDPRMLFKRIFFVFASTVFTSITVLPYRIALSVYYLTGGSRAMINVVYALWFLLPLSAILNPIIIVVTQRSYRNGLRKMFAVCGVKSPCQRRRVEHILETEMEAYPDCSSMNA